VAPVQYRVNYGVKLFVLDKWLKMALVASHGTVVVAVSRKGRWVSVAVRLESKKWVVVSVRTADNWG